MLKRVFTTLFAMLAMTGAVLAFSSCSTMAGAGQDIQKVGGAITNEANQHR